MSRGLFQFDVGMPFARRRRKATVAALSASLLATVALQAALPLGARAVNVVQGSCYDALYFDGLTSRYSANHCAGALNTAGYAGTAYHNTSAQQALQNSVKDGVFFFAGHSIDFFEPGSTAHAGVGLIYESPDSSGNLDALAEDPITAADMTGLDAKICSEGGGCKTQTVFAGYPWADLPSMAIANLVVLEGCATAQDTPDFPSLATTVNGALAGTVVGFHDDIGFSVNADESNLFGDGWANKFWSDAGAGVSYLSAVIDASNSVGNANGYGSYKVLQSAGAPQTLYPAQYWL